METLSEPPPVELVIGQTTEEFQILHVVLRVPAVGVEVLGMLRVPEELRWDRGVVINGRAPVWLYAALVHLCHPARWIATVDPRLGGAVVVVRHHPDAPAIGQVIPLAPELIAIPTQAAD